jgi:hypothetical protein
MGSFKEDSLNAALELVAGKGCGTEAYFRDGSG